MALFAYSLVVAWYARIGHRTRFATAPRLGTCTHFNWVQVRD